MNTLIIIFIILGLAAAWFFFVKMPKDKKLEEESAEEGSEDLRIENVGVNGAFCLQGVGANLEDIDCIVMAKHVYSEGSSEWFELECQNGSEKVWVEVEEDDALAVSVTLRKFSLSDLGVSESQLEKIDDDEAGCIDFEGTRYVYDDSGKATFYRDGDKSKGEDFYYWDFETEDELKFLAVERWGNSDYEASCAESVSPSQISVFSTKG